MSLGKLSGVEFRMFDTEEQYRKKVLELRKEKKLHSITQAKIVEIFRREFPGSFVVPESAKTSRGHRADTVIHLADGRVVHFEIFCHANTVSRDVNSLENSNADFLIAVVLDDVDKHVSDTYFHELESRGLPSNAYTIIQLSEILVSSNEEETISRLKQLLQQGVAWLGRISLNELRLPAKQWYVVHKAIESEVVKVLRRRTSTSNLFVTGPRGIGKSSLLNHIHLLATARTCVPVKCTVINESWSEMLIQLDKQLQDVLERFGGYPIKHKAVSYEEMLIEILKELISRVDRTIVIIIDQFERLFEKGEMRTTQVETEKVWKSFSSVVSQSNVLQKVRWIIAAREQYYFVLFPRFGSLEECEFSYVAVPLFSRNESEQLLDKISMLTRFKLTSDAKRILLENVGNHPQNIILSFVNLCEGRNPSIRIDETAVSKQQPWLEVFEKDFSKLTTQTEKLIIYAIAHTQKEVCTIKEIMDRVSLKIHISETELRNILRHMQNVLNLIQQPKADAFEFYHARFADFIKEKYSHEIPEEWDVHRLIEVALTLVRERDHYTSLSILEKVIKISSDYNWVFDKAEAIAIENEEPEFAAKLVEKSFKLLGGLKSDKGEKALQYMQMAINKERDPWKKVALLCRLASYRIGSPFYGYEWPEYWTTEFYGKVISTEKARLFLNNALSELQKLKSAKMPIYDGKAIADFLYRIEEFDAALNIYLLIFSEDPSSYFYDCVDKAIYILLKQHKKKEAFNLCIQASSTIKGWVKKAEWLQIAAKLAWKTSPKESLRLFEESFDWYEKATEASRSERACINYYTRMVEIKKILTSREESRKLFQRLLKSIRDVTLKGSFERQCEYILSTN